MAGMVEGKVALITGGGSGIGRASAHLFVREGAKAIVLADMNVEGGEETREMVEKAGGSAIFIKTDVTKVEDVQAMVSSAVEMYGRIDCACNIAGVFLPGSVDGTSEELWNLIVGVDLTGVWRCMKYEFEVMFKQGSGTIVNMASIAGVTGAPNYAAYTSAKAGVVNLTRTAALEVAQKGIRVNAVCPGVIRTPMILTPESTREIEEAYAAAHPIGRMGEAEEIAEAVLWLSSERSSFVTGEHLVVDGGYTIQ